MRLHILGDLHLEFGMAPIPATDADVVVLPGDIHLGREGRRWARRHFQHKPVVYVLGNHEFYRRSLPGLTKTLKRETDGSRIHLLENCAVEINGYTFLGCTLWTDFQLALDPEAAMQAAEAIMSDYSLIQFGPKNRLLRARDSARLHAESVAWLRSELAKCDRAHTIVVTHHAPSVCGTGGRQPCRVRHWRSVGNRLADVGWRVRTQRHADPRARTDSTSADRSDA